MVHSALAEAASADRQGGGFEFERAVREALEAKGWTVHPQVGVSGFRLTSLSFIRTRQDAILRQSSATERHIIVRLQRVTVTNSGRRALRRLGWRVRRVWSTDWWNDAERSLDELQARLEQTWPSRGRRTSDGRAGEGRCSGDCTADCTAVGTSRGAHRRGNSA